MAHTGITPSDHREHLHLRLAFLVIYCKLQVAAAVALTVLAVVVLVDCLLSPHNF
jgi:hypothetical protein